MLSACEFCRQGSEAEIPAWAGQGEKEPAEHTNKVKIDMVATLRETRLCNHSAQLSIDLGSEN